MAFSIPSQDVLFKECSISYVEFPDPVVAMCCTGLYESKLNPSPPRLQWYCDASLLNQSSLGSRESSSPDEEDEDQSVRNNHPA